jgi:hypothetical protein
MGITLNGLTPAGTYPGLIKTGDNTAISGTPKVLSDGNGNDLPMEVSTTGVNFTNNLTQGGTALQPVLVSGTNIKTINGASLLGSGNIPVVTSPSGVAGAIQFSNGSAFASDASNLFWDDTNNRLGVGTNAPARPLTVVGSTNDIVAQIDALSNAYNTQLQLRTYSSNSAELLITGNIGTTPSNVGVMGGNTAVGLTLTAFGSNNIQFYTTNSFVPRFRINNDGNIGAGTTSPTAKMHIQGSGSTSATTSLLVQNSAGAELLRVRDDGNVFLTALFINSLNTMDRGSGLRINYAPTSDPINFYTGFGTNRLSITNDGNIGMGTISPNASALLDMTSTTQGLLPPRMTTTQKNAITSPAAGLVVYDSTTNKLCCYNGSTWNDLF